MLERAGATDAETVTFLQWAVPRIGLRWAGFRNVRGTVRKRIVRRMNELGLRSLEEYRGLLEADPAEWSELAVMCRIPISRFYRDRAVFDTLASDVLPARAGAAAQEGRTTVQIWSAGCASGEEAYTVAILWEHAVAARHPGIRLEILATDIDEMMLSRAERGSYAPGSLRELPADTWETGFVREDGAFRVRDEIRRDVTFRRQDTRELASATLFDVILCRNSAFTYFDEATQRAVATGLTARLRAGGVLVVGSHESLPSEFEAVRLRAPSIYERRG